MSSASNTSTISSVGAPNRRNTELALLVFAVVIPLLAYANVGLAKNGSVPAGMAGYGLGMGAFAAVVRNAARRRKALATFNQSTGHRHSPLREQHPA